VTTRPEAETDLIRVATTEVVSNLHPLESEAAPLQVLARLTGLAKAASFKLQLV